MRSKNSLYILLCFFFIFNSSAATQLPDWNLAKSFGGGSNYSYSVTVDREGNIYSTGNFSGTTDFDPGPATYKVTADSINSASSYISKLNSMGDFVWVKIITCTNYSIGRSIKTDPRGNIYLAGYYSDTINIDSVNYSGYSSSFNAFICKLDSNGNYIWVKNISGNGGFINVYSLVIDSLNNVYYSGGFKDTIDFNPDPAFNYKLVANAPQTYQGLNAFVSKLDSNGSFLWAKSFGEYEDLSVFSMCLDDLSNIYVTGYFTGVPDFNPDTNISVYLSTGWDESAAFVAAFNANGQFKWAKKIIPSDYGAGNAIACDNNGNVLVSAHAMDYGDIIAKIDSMGTIKWSKKICSECSGSSISINKFGTIFLAGLFDYGIIYNATPPYQQLISEGDYDAFILACDSAANIKWAKGIGGIYEDAALSLTMDPWGGIITSGYFSSPILAFDNSNLTLSKTGNINLVIGRLSCLSTSTLNPIGCENYQSPSGKYVCTSSGTYLDTIPNSNGCDSIITINLTIINSSSASQTVAACHYFVSPSGNSIWTNSGTYIDTIPNALGCDSIITTILLINDNENTITQSGCDSLTFNGQKYTSSGIYSQTFTNAGGCDSTLFLNLTIYQSSPQTFQQSACDSMEWDGQVYYASGTYLHPYSNAAGCDSTITLELTITSSSSSSISETVCSDFTLNGITYASSGSYIQTVTNTAGCDSTITLQLTLNSTSSSITQTACDSILVNGQKYTTSGVYTQTLINAASCDSVITLNLSINHSSTLNSSISACKSYFVNGSTYTASGLYHLPFVNASGCASMLNLNLTIIQPDTSLNQNANVLTSNANGVTYQWLDCNTGFQPIPGANAKNYTALANGSYAVALTKNSCSDTSACYTVLSIGIDGNSFSEKNISIYPNPSSNGIFMLDCGPSSSTHVALEIYNMLGAVVYSKNTFQIFKGKQILDLSALPSGSYFAAVKTGNEKKMIRLVIQ